MVINGKFSVMIPAIPKFSVKPGYRPQAEDTSIETDLLTFHLLRQRTAGERLQMAASLTRSARKLSLSSLRQHFRNLSPSQFAQKVAVAWLQEYCPANFIPRGESTMWIQDSVSLATKLHPIFEELGIAYYITGEVAAIAYGEPRTTQDLDLVMVISLLDIRLLAKIAPTGKMPIPQKSFFSCGVGVPPAQEFDEKDFRNRFIERLSEALSQAGFYVSGVDDLKSGRMRTLPITDMESISRADLMVAGTEQFERLKFERRRVIEFEGSRLYFASPEDLILTKLWWRQRSGSQKQWRDVLGVLKVQAENLDFDYLAQGAGRLGIAEELSQALGESGR